MHQIPFYKPSIGEPEINEVVDCLRSGWLTTAITFAKSLFASAATTSVRIIRILRREHSQCTHQQ